MTLGRSAGAANVCGEKSVDANTMKQIVVVFIKVWRVVLVIMLCFTYRDSLGVFLRVVEP